MGRQGAGHERVNIGGVWRDRISFNNHPCHPDVGLPSTAEASVDAVRSGDSSE